jgi:2-dehydro-3-deoxy-D-arabinonate dehydratase
MLLYHTTSGIYLHHQDQWHPVTAASWDELFNSPELHSRLQQAATGPTVAPPAADSILAPIGSQEVWAAGVTYFRSRTARMEESKDAGGGSFYDRVYDAPRPEIFFKATPQRVVAPGGTMHLRSDSTWMVPELELILAINASGQLIGFTCGNDLSCRDIEGENPLYLPQAKCFAACAAIGPAIFISNQPLAPDTTIQCHIQRSGATVFSGDTTLEQLKRSPQELIHYLYLDNSFPTGAFLMTGTGIVPPDDFTLQAGDLIHIQIAHIGTLSNTVA